MSIEQAQAPDPVESRKRKHEHREIVENPSAAGTARRPPTTMQQRDPLHPVPREVQGVLNRSGQPSWFPSVLEICQEHGDFADDELTRSWLAELQHCTSHKMLQDALAENTPESQRALAAILRTLGQTPSVSFAEVALGLRLSGLNAQVELALGLIVGCPYTLEPALQGAIANALNHAKLWPLFVPHTKEGLQALIDHNRIAAPALHRMMIRLMAK